jgi:hypothetical protein
MGAMTPASMSTGVRRKAFLVHNINTTGPCDLAEPQDDGTGAESDFLHTPQMHNTSDQAENHTFDNF